MEPKPTKIQVVIQGWPVVNDGYVLARGKNVAAVMVDMGSKNCQIRYQSRSVDVESIGISGDGALHLTTGHEQEDTEIVFPDFRGWTIHCAELSRYTLSVCFVKP